MKDYERLILNHLLDRYERSGRFRGTAEDPGASGGPDPATGPTRVRGVFLPLDPKTFPDYWVEETPDYRLEINRAAQALAGRGLIALHWAPLAKGHQLSKVSLVLERVEEAYAAARRQPRRDKEEALRAVVQAWLGRWSARSSAAGEEPEPPGGDAGFWGAAFLQEVLQALRAHRALPLGLSLDDPAELDRLCRVIDALAGLEEEVPRRIFSARLLGDSKALEGRLGGLLVRAARLFAQGGDLEGDLEDDREVLAGLGLVDNPQHVFLSGPLVLRYRGRLVDIGAFRPDVGLPLAMVQEAEVEELAVRAVLTVENLTSYHEAVRVSDQRRKGEPGDAVLLVYLGGYHSRARRQLLVKLWRHAQRRQVPIPFYHWGDLDLGGLQIFHHLAERTGIPLQPWLMDRETYRAHAGLGTLFGEAYGARLQDLVGRPGYEPFAELLPEMLRRRIRVEQESVEPRLPPLGRSPLFPHRAGQT